MIQICEFLIITKKICRFTFFFSFWGITTASLLRSNFQINTAISKWSCFDKKKDTDKFETEAIQLCQLLKLLLIISLKTHLFENVRIIDDRNYRTAKSHKKESKQYFVKIIPPRKQNWCCHNCCFMMSSSGLKMI